MEPRDDLERGLHEMLHDLPPHDDRARRATLEALPSTRQRRYGWLPITGAGWASPAYAGLAATAVLVLVVGLLVTSIRFAPEQAGTASPDLSPPQTFTGSIACGPEAAPSTTTISEIEVGDSGAHLMEYRGAAYDLSIESIDDPRLDGRLTDRIDTDGYGIGAGVPEMAALTWTLENAEGTWTTRFHSFVTEPADWSTATTRWDGSGAYDGLAAIMQIDYRLSESGMTCGWDVHGVVVPAELLPAHPQPEPSLRSMTTDSPAGP